jgi:protein-disulfide isomerase
LIRQCARLLSAVALIAFIVPVIPAVAQQHVPPAPDAGQQTPAAPAPPTAEPSAPAPTTAPAFPKVDPADFTATSPTKETVDAFMHANWGFDENRVWQVQKIMKTPVDGVSEVVILAADKASKQQQLQPVVFFVMPDGKHIIAGDSIINFGANPFADFRREMQEHADGPYRGSAAKDLEIVEFFDFQCPHCKEAQANMDKLVADFPKARIVSQNWPIASIHPQAMQAAEFGACVNKMGGSSAFFQFSTAVFDGQDGLATADGAALTLNSAVIKAGQDPTKVAACASTPEIKASVDASIKLGMDNGITQVPTLLVNGRQIPANIPYETLKRIIDFQAKLDGVSGQ